MGFQHAEQQAHKIAGMKAAAASPRTPAHLRPHLMRRIGVTTVRPIAAKSNNRFRPAPEPQMNSDGGDDTTAAKALKGLGLEMATPRIAAPKKLVGNKKLKVKRGKLQAAPQPDPFYGE